MENNRTNRILNSIYDHPRIKIEENFNKFLSWSKPSRRVLVMSFFKRTFKLLMCVNLNIPVVSVTWLQCLTNDSGSQTQVALERFFLKRTEHTYNFDQLKAAYFYRKTLGKGFLHGHTIIGKIWFF